MAARARLLAVAMAAAVLAGCSSDDGDPAPAPASTAPAAQADDAQRTTASPTSIASLAGLVPGRTINDSAGHSITVTPVTLRREGKLALFEISARNEDPDESVNVADIMRGSGTQFDEVTLIDPAGGKRYLVARDSKDACLCTSFVGGLRLEPGAVAVVSAYFAAPPAAVRTMNVELPTGGAFTGVPVSG